MKKRHKYNITKIEGKDYIAIIEGLDNVYFYNCLGELTSFSGAVALLNTTGHCKDGYTQLFTPYRHQADDIGKIVIDFLPVYNKDRELVFLNINRECPFLCIDHHIERINDEKITTLRIENYDKTLSL